MRGTIRERDEGVWEIRAFVGRDPVTAKPRQVSRVVRGGKRDAEKRLAELVTEVSAGRVDTTRVTFGHLFDSWLEQQEHLGRSPVTLRNLECVIAAVLKPELGKTYLQNLKPATLDAFYGRQANVGKAPTTIRRYHSHIAAALEQALKWGWISSNVARSASPPSMHPPEVVAPEIGTLRALLEDAERRNPRLAPALALAALTGARRAELCGLRWDDLDVLLARVTIRRAVVRDREPGGLVVKETKTGRVRRIALDPISLEILERHRIGCEAAAQACGVPLADKSYVFSPDVDCSTPYNPETLTALFGRCRDKIGHPDLRLHHLRHFSATQLIAAGVDVRTVAGRLGHSSPSITLNVYSHFIENADREAARRMGELMSHAFNASPTTGQVLRP